MTVKTAAERTKASRLRARKASGEKLSPEQREWLRSYDAAPAAVIEEATVIEETRDVSQSPAAAQQASARPASWVAVERPPDARPPAVPLGPSTKVDGAPTPAVCKIKDCPACSGRSRPGPQKCATTGEDVYPPLSQAAAEMLAGVLFAIIGLGIKIFRGTEAVHPPTEIQRKQLARGIIEITRRRAGWIAVYDDLLVAGWALGAYTRGAMAAPKALPKPKEPTAAPVSEAAE